MFKRIGTHYFALDLLRLDNTDLRPDSLERRKSILQDLLGSCDPVRYCDHVAKCGNAFYQTVEKQVLKGWSRSAAGPLTGAVLPATG